MGLFGNHSFAEFGTLLRAANAAFGKSAPAGWTQLRMSDLGIDQSGDTFTSRNGRGKAIVLEKEDQLIVAFRGTDKWNDIKDYDNISFVKSYSRQFDKLLDKVAKYQDAHDKETTFTGISLGAAVTNIIADKAGNQWGKAFVDASFVGIASPYLSNHGQRDLFNFGMQNDLIYGIVPGSWNPGSRRYATEHVYIYENKQFWIDNLDDSLAAHRVGGLNRAVASLQGLTVDGGGLLVDVLRPDSYLIFDNTKETLRVRELHNPRKEVVTVVGEGRADRIAGTGGDDRFYGMGGNDTLIGKGGRDELHGQSGDDLLNGGGGRDVMFGDGGNDRLIFDTHGDRGEGGAGRDRFVIHTIAREEGKTATVFLPDFTPGKDKIVLKDFDGNRHKKGDQPLHFVEYAVYDASDGLSRLERGYVNDLKPGGVTIFEDKNGDTLLIINRDGDRGREFEIHFDGALGDFSKDLLF